MESPGRVPLALQGHKWTWEPCHRRLAAAKSTQHKRGASWLSMRLVPKSGNTADVPLKEGATLTGL